MSSRSSRAGTGDHDRAIRRRFVKGESANYHRASTATSAASRIDLKQAAGRDVVAASWPRTADLVLENFQALA